MLVKQGMKQTKILVFLLIVSAVLAGCGEISPAELNQVEKNPPTAAAVQPTATPDPDGVLLGMYPGGFLKTRAQEIDQIDSWIAPTGKRVSIAATFIDLEDPDPIRAIPAEMEAAWARGYTPFVNLSAGNLGTPWTAEQIAEGALDPEIRAFARAYARWSQGGEKKALIAPLQEMNGYWTSYGEDPEHFQEAYRRIQAIFQEEGVPPEAVGWVFSPNGWSAEGKEFELFYPGDEVVDVVGFNSFNFGDCSAWPKWETYDEIFLPYLERLHQMAPEKPIFISSLGTVEQGGDKDQWLKVTYQKLVEFPNLRAVLYFNRWEVRESLGHCPDGTDYRVYVYPSGKGRPGYLEAIDLPEITYYAPGSAAMGELMFGGRLRR